jgi:predicted molibdopterin-dependent oxidoreductase YjgC
MKCEVAGSCKLQSRVQEAEMERKWPHVERGEQEHHSEHMLHDHTHPRFVSSVGVFCIIIIVLFCFFFFFFFFFFLPSTQTHRLSTTNQSIYVNTKKHSIQRDLNKCIECGLCVQACGDGMQHLNIIGFAERGGGMLPVTVFDKPLNETNCISCGQCTAVCPVIETSFIILCV